MFNSNDTSIICIDLQQKLVNMLNNGERIKNNAVKLMKAASILNISTLITEQYPKGLGETVYEIKEIKDFKTIEKTTFSAYRTEEFKKEFKKLKNHNVIIFGIEAHICVFQTAMDLIEKGYNVFVVADCTSSRAEINYVASLETLKQSGAKIITLEMALFEFLKSSNHPNFKEIQGLIK